MKQVKLTFTILLLTVFASLKAQEIGFSINRGVTGLCPDYKSFASTLNQGYGIGITKYRPLRKSLIVQTGVYVTFIRSCLSVQNAEGLVTFIPQKYTFIDMPISIEKTFFRYSKITRKASHYAVSAGINFAYLMHERNFKEHTGNSYHANPLNIGASTAFQFVKAINWKTSFAIGPHFQAFSTGEDDAIIALYVGFKLDWKFGQY